MQKTRVQIPAYTDRWMMGDRYGVIFKVSRPSLKAGTSPRRVKYYGAADIAHVKLDKSGKTVRVVLADCEVL